MTQPHLQGGLWSVCNDPVTLQVYVYMEGGGGVSHKGGSGGGVSHKGRSGRGVSHKGGLGEVCHTREGLGEVCHTREGLGEVCHTRESCTVYIYYREIISTVTNSFIVMVMCCVPGPLRTCLLY